MKDFVMFVFILLWLFTGAYWVITLMRSKIDKKYRPAIKPVYSFFISLACFTLAGIFVPSQTNIPVKNDTCTVVIKKWEWHVDEARNRNAINKAGTMFRPNLSVVLENQTKKKVKEVVLKTNYYYEYMNNGTPMKSNRFPNVTIYYSTDDGNILNPSQTMRYVDYLLSKAEMNNARALDIVKMNGYLYDSHQKPLLYETVNKADIEIAKIVFE